MVKLYYSTEPDKDCSGVKFHHLYHDYPLYHGHDFFEFFICTSGSYIQNINGENKTFNKYDCCLLTPKDSHSIIDNDSKTGHYAIEVSISFFEKFCSGLGLSLFEKIDNGTYQTFTITEYRLRQIISYLNQIRDMPDGEDKEIINNLLLFNLMEPIITNTKLVYADNKSEWLNDLLIEINKPANLYWSVNDVINNSNYSHTHLSRMFKEEMNESLVQYLTDVKMANARDLLINSDISLEEICNILGYSSLSHFNNLFKKYYGLTPGKYRNKYKNKYN